MRLAERNRLRDSILNEAVTSRVAAVMAREVATSEGFAEDIALSLTTGIESDAQARRWLITSALSSHALTEALIRKLVREMS